MNHQGSKPADKTVNARQQERGDSKRMEQEEARKKRIAEAGARLEEETARRQNEMARTRRDREKFYRERVAGTGEAKEGNTGAQSGADTKMDQKMARMEKDIAMKNIERIENKAE